MASSFSCVLLFVACGFPTSTAASGVNRLRLHFGRAAVHARMAGRSRGRSTIAEYISSRGIASPGPQRGSMHAARSGQWPRWCHCQHGVTYVRPWPCGRHICYAMLRVETFNVNRVATMPESALGAEIMNVIIICDRAALPTQDRTCHHGLADLIWLVVGIRARRNA
ncbi:hypothetical protein BC826DRAFT_193738 [Russula brevipes]|nr:hypothetical protein BC826DRAFT_193738 [Russula brevipes]